MLTRSKTKRLSERSSWNIPPRDLQPVAEMVGHYIREDERSVDWDHVGDFWQLGEMEGADWEPTMWVVPGHLAPWNERFDSLPKRNPVLLTQCHYTLLMVDPAALKYLEDNFTITTRGNVWAHFAMLMMPWTAYHSRQRLHTPGNAPNYPGTRFICRRSWHCDKFPAHPAKPVLYISLVDWATLKGCVDADGLIDCEEEE